MSPITKFYIMVICMQVAAFALGMIFERHLTKLIQAVEQEAKNEDENS